MTPEQELSLINAVRRIAAEEITPRFRALSREEVDEKQDQDDLVTIADTRTEAAITRAAEALLPGVVVVGEEGVAAGTVSLDVIGTAERCLIVDPVDGTWNFANGVAVFGVILALVEKGVTTWACIYDPLGDDWMTARPGEGARLTKADGKSRAVHVATAPALDDAFALLPLYLYHGEERAWLAGASMRFRRTWSLRCSAHEYRLIADGRADFILNGAMHPWDHAAGALIYREAGGVARLLTGEEYAPSLAPGRLLCAPSEAMWSDLAELFEPLALRDAPTR